MPQIELFTNAPVAAALDAVAASCTPEGFAIDSESDTRLTVRKGSLAMSILLGVFVVYANADVKAKETDEGETRLTFEWGTTWWQGVFGPGRTRTAMVALVDRVEDELEDAGFRSLERFER
jgi:hypothetical protein